MCSAEMATAIVLPYVSHRWHTSQMCDSGGMLISLRPWQCQHYKTDNDVWIMSCDATYDKIVMTLAPASDKPAQWQATGSPFAFGLLMGL